MANNNAPPYSDIIRLILPPSIITLAITILRLTGELRHWPPRWFSTETGGTIPAGVSWIVGITWLAAPLGIYFAIHLAKSGLAPRSIPRALVLAALGLIILIGFRFPVAYIPLRFPAILIAVWLFMVIAAALQYFAWPALFKTLLLYGFAARIPVAIVMFLAMLGNWGTHYDYVGMPPRFSMPLVPRYFWLAFFPQIVFWVAFTIVAGSICGILVTSLVRFKPSAGRIDLG